jgi:hypothetical protein
MLRIAARLVSFAFHPLLILTYMLVLLLLINPYLFGINHIGSEFSRVLILQFFLFTFFIPAFSIFMLRALGLVKTPDLRERTDRIGPYIITGILYLWLYQNVLANNQVPTVFSVFMLGCTIALFVAFFINIFSRISAHTVGMGALIGMLAIVMTQYSYGTFSIRLEPVNWEVNVFLLFLTTIVLAGLVGTARLILLQHKNADLYGGYLVGFSAQLLALGILL